jgi:xylulokinase
MLGAAYGDAFIAAAAVGLVDGSPSDGRHPWVRTVDVVEPDPRSHDVYAERYRLYRDLYRATQPIVHELSAEKVENGGAVPQPRPTTP